MKFCKHIKPYFSLSALYFVEAVNINVHFFVWVRTFTAHYDLSFFPPRIRMMLLCRNKWQQQSCHIEFFYASNRHPHIWVLLCNERASDGGDFTWDVKVYANSSLYLISMNVEWIFFRLIHVYFLYLRTLNTTQVYWSINVLGLSHDLRNFDFRSWCWITRCCGGLRPMILLPPGFC